MVGRKWIFRASALTLAVLPVGAFVLFMSAQRPNERGAGNGDSAPSSGDGAPVEAAEERGAQIEAAPAPLFFGVTTPSGPYNLAELDAFEAAAGQRPAVLMFSQDWTQGPVRLELLDRVHERGMLPMISWEPRDHKSSAGAEQPQYALSRILDGRWDRYIREWAEGVRDWGRPIAVRFGQQMNGSWFPWAEGVNGNQPGQYADAWRHVHRIFEEVRASNVTWVWSPNVGYIGSAPLGGLYPGEDHVDWVGIDGYNGGSQLPWGGWVSAEHLLQSTISELRSFTGKPLVLTEVASTEVGGDKAAWIRELLDTVAGHGDLMGFVWVEAAREADWRIVSSPEAAEAFARGVATHPFGPVPGWSR